MIGKSDHKSDKIGQGSPPLRNMRKLYNLQNDDQRDRWLGSETQKWLNMPSKIDHI